MVAESTVIRTVATTRGSKTPITKAGITRIRKRTISTAGTSRRAQDADIDGVPLGNPVFVRVVGPHGKHNKIDQE